MTKTLVQIKKEMAKLQELADRVRAKEVAGVITRIKVAIEFYGLSRSDLFGNTSKPEGKRGTGKRVKVPKKQSTPKYRDQQTGKTWTGHGKRPGWFVKALESGKRAEDMAI